jgi:hypothetical protein
MQTLTFDMNATTADGVQVPVKLEIEYPDGHGFNSHPERAAPPQQRLRPEGDDDA